MDIYLIKKENSLKLIQWTIFCERKQQTVVVTDRYGQLGLNSYNLLVRSHHFESIKIFPENTKLLIFSDKKY